jgi:poly(3-hydroxybutyrate) depolymerase
MILAGCQGTAGTGGGNVSGAGGGGDPGGAGTGGAGTGGHSGGGGSSAGTGGSSVGPGGATGAGGNPTTTGGAGGSPTTTGVGGATGGVGCGAATWPAGEMTYSIDVGGTARTFIVGLPAGYNGSRAERLVLAFHGRTGTAAQIAGTGTRGYYGLRARMTDTIFVAPQGLGTAADATDTGWPNTNGQDIAFVRALLAWAGTNYCVDQSRIFATGFSYGGIMSHTIACQMSDVFRAVGPMAGAIFGRTTSCLTHPIAAWITHGTMDTAAAGGVDYSAGQTARDRIVALNHCQATTTAVAPSPCVSYDGCDSGYPVHWCVHDGAHVIPTFAAEGISTFFLQF